MRDVRLKVEGIPLAKRLGSTSMALRVQDPFSTVNARVREEGMLSKSEKKKR